MIKYRAVKGAPLTEEDIDVNFKELELRIEKLEREKQKPMENVNFHLEGDLLLMNDGVAQKSVGRLPLIHFKPKGPWLEGHAYEPLDLVLYQDQIFCCQQNHLSKETLEIDEAFWTLFFKTTQGGVQ